MLSSRKVDEVLFVEDREGSKRAKVISKNKRDDVVDDAETDDDGDRRQDGGDNEDMESLELAVFGYGDKTIKSVLAMTKNAQEMTQPALTEEKKPAWIDDDDDQIRVDVTSKNRMRKLRETEEEIAVTGSKLTGRLRSQFEKLHGKPTWADEQLRQAAIDEDGDVDGANTALLRSTKRLLDSSSSRLVRGTIDISRVKDGNHRNPSAAVIQSVHFHPTAPALLTAGFDKTLRIFQVDGRHNNLMSSTFIRNFPMHSAAFSPDGSEIIMSSRRPYFYSFDLETGSVLQIKELTGRKEKSLESMWMSPDNQFITFTGRDGNILLVSRKTKQWITNLKMNQSCRRIAFSPDSRYMYSTGDEGRVYVWDMNTRDCIHVFEDEGSQCGTSIAVSPDGNTIATGSDAGVVNIYDESHRAVTRPKPIKTLMNLVTTIDNLAFNHDGNVLCMASRMKRDALRLVHVPSLTVYKNWPSHSTVLRYTHAMAFSPHSGYLATGNDKGTVPLFRLNHFDSY
eukprot:m.54398 g.54398  ORF g.54398 m.54398 type:complete len:509 (+) comp12865_c0_seq2:51-1577(+)